MGPNDASGVVWALGEYFFMFFLILTNTLLDIQVSIYDYATWKAE